MTSSGQPIQLGGVTIGQPVRVGGTRFGGPITVPGGGSGSAGRQLVGSMPAGHTLSGHRAVTATSAGTLEYASNIRPDHVWAPLWLTLGAANTGTDAEVLLIGPIDEPSWTWQPGPIYLGRDGQLTQTPPAAADGDLFLAQLGAATSPTSIFLDRAPSILLT